MSDKKKYTFVTIVAPEEVRTSFTSWRDELKATDKLLMQALWELSQEHKDAIEARVAELKEQKVPRAPREKRLKPENIVVDEAPNLAEVVADNLNNTGEQQAAPKAPKTPKKAKKIKEKVTEQEGITVVEETTEEQ